MFCAALDFAPRVSSTHGVTNIKREEVEKNEKLFSTLFQPEPPQKRITVPCAKRATVIQIKENLQLTLLPNTCRVDLIWLWDYLDIAARFFYAPFSKNSPAQFFAQQLVISGERLLPYPGVDFCHLPVFIHPWMGLSIKVQPWNQTMSTLLGLFHCSGPGNCRMIINKKRVGVRQEESVCPGRCVNARHSLCAGSVWKLLHILTIHSTEWPTPCAWRAAPQANELAEQEGPLKTASPALQT